MCEGFNLEDCMRKLPKDCPCRVCDNDCDEPCDKVQELIERNPAYEHFAIGCDGPGIYEDGFDEAGIDPDDFFGEDTDEDDRVLDFDD
jgi:hypothetical protein